MKLKLTKKGSGDNLHISALGLDVEVILSGDDTNDTISIFEDTVPPGVGPPRHIHHSQDEIFLVREGKFKVEIDEKEVFLESGDVAFVPLGLVHAFKNIGDSTGAIRYTFTPAGGAEAMLREMAAAPANATPEALTAIAAKYDTTIVGLPL